MRAIVILVALLLLFGAFVFILLFGESPRLRDGPFGKAHRVLTVNVPEKTVRALKRVLGPKYWNWLATAWKYCFESRNPFLQVFFVILTSGAIVLFLKYGLPHVPGIYLGSVHSVIIPLQIFWLYISYYIACAADPGIITKDNVDNFLEYFQYDGIIYKPGNECRTCKIVKPARSKHCSLCNACVGRLDHHCAWISSCVGVNNHRYFLLFLFTLTEFCTYGAYLCFQIYRGFIIEWRLDKAYIYDSSKGTQVPLSFRKAMIHILQKDRIIGSIGILATVAAFVVFLFLLYQLYLIGIGMTTNEAFKWELVEDAIDRGDLFVQEEDPDKEFVSHKVKQRSSKKTGAEGRGDKKWRRIDSLEEVDNIYDRGFVGNLAEVLFPPDVIRRKKR
ncbi:hypothetical protein VTP01DRAFT_5470 [Rhizomucor pusillus]|uniref:uncharacterized protein n=1 Tax=Rhizomucor pusillus TaxID=4840 RepID=UPI003744446E